MGSFAKAIHTALGIFLLGAVFFCPHVSAQDELILVSPHWDGVKYEFTKAFEQYYLAKTGKTVRLRWRDLGGTSQIEKALDSLYKATPDSSGIDVFFGGGMDPFMRRKTLGQLQSYRLPLELLSQFPSHVAGVPLYDDDFTYYGTVLASFGIVENRKIIDFLGLPPVKTWEDLCDPRLAGWVSSADPRKSGSVHMIYEIMLQAYGWEKGWKVIIQSSANLKSFLQQSSAPTKEVSSGEVAYAITIDINGMVQQEFLGRDAIRFFIPEGVSIMNPDGIAILKGAPHLEVAQTFVRFVMSEEGQRLWMTPLGKPGGPRKFTISRMSILPKLYDAMEASPMVPLNPFKASFPLVYRADVGSKRWGLLNEIMGRTVIDPQPQLKAAWKTANAAPEPLRSRLIAELSQPPLTEAEAAQVLPLFKTNPALAEQIALGWLQKAFDQYARIEREARNSHVSKP